MFKRIDESKFLSNLVQQLSEGLARQRGLPVIIGIGLLIISLIVNSINAFAGSEALELLGVVIHHLGVLIALIGLLLANPLGK